MKTLPSRASRRLELLLLEDRVVPASWTDLAAIPASPTGASTYTRPDSFRAVAIDTVAIRSELAAAPAEESVWFGQSAGLTFTLPRPDGTTATFAVADSPVVEPALAAQYPDIKTYAGKGIDDPSATIRFDVTPIGFHAQILSGKTGAWYIDPYYHLETQVYVSYFSHDLHETLAFTDSHTATPADQPSSGFAAFGPGGGGGGSGGGSGGTAARSGATLRTYRLALAVTGEYTQFFGGTVANGLAGVVSAVNRLSGVYENELSIRFKLIANESSLIYTNPATDPYTNTDGSALLDENQTNLDSVIGNANYDFGHVFATSGGGLAALGAVGFAGRKAQAETGSPTPDGDSFWIDYVAHEMGHSFNANHSFNTSSDSNRNGPTAYEPGSGSTIMSYAGITGSDSDLQSNSDAYFHSVNFDEIIAFVDNTIPSVGTRTATGNSVPTVNAGLDYTIPTGTFFALTASGTDANGDTLTYDWEERDLGPATLLSTADNGSSPIFRSFNPTTNPTRTFPQSSDLLNNTTTPGEKLYAQARTSNFRVTVRDNRIGGGGVNTDDAIINVVNTGAPFILTAPNTAVNWTGNTSQTVTWNVAGTTANGINAANVRISLSIDGGLTYPITVKASTPNDGSEFITVPNVDTTMARIRVQPTNNVFFDISNANFSIVAIPGITVTPTSGLITTEAGGTATFTVVLDSQPTSDVTIPISSSNTAEGTVSTASLVFTTANWFTPKLVTVTGVDDPFIDGDIAYTIITGAATSSDAKYAGRNAANVSVVNLNNDFAGYTVTPTTGLTTTEAGGTATFSIVLISPPSSNVRIPLSSSNLAEGTVAPAFLLFTTSNWQTAQTVTITGADDAVVDGNIAYTIVTGAAISGDSGYSGLNPADVSVTNLNNDTGLSLTDVGSNHRYGQSVGFTATLTGLGGNPTTGTVAFSFGAVSLGTFPVVNGVASMSTLVLPIGTDLVTATYSGDGFYLGSSSNTSVVIGNALLSVAALPASKVYGAIVPGLFYAASGYVDGDTAAIITGALDTTTTATSAAGLYPITRGTLNTTDNGTKYDVLFTPGTLTVTPAILSVSAIDQTKLYGAAVPTLTYTKSGFVNSDTSSILTGGLSTSATTASSVGTYPVQIGTLSAGGNYSIAYTPAAVAVTAAPLLITPFAATKQYGPAALPALPYTPTGFVNGDGLAVLSGSLATTALATSSVAQYPITLGTVAAGANYALSLAPALLSITPATLTVIADDATSRAGAPAPDFTYRATGFVNGDGLSVLSGLVLTTTANEDSAIGTYPIAVTAGLASNYSLNRVNGTLTLTVSTVLVGPDSFSVGADVGGTDVVKVYRADGSLKNSYIPFPGFFGGIRTATGDVNGDGIADLAVGTGPGTTATVQVIDGATGAILLDFQPFDDFIGGVFVSLGDMDGDKKAELVVTPDVGGGPRVQIFHGGDLTLQKNFFGIDDPKFRGGARTALGDINGDGFADLVISAGFGGGPRISILDGKQLSQDRYRFLSPDFFVFSEALRDGTFVAVGDVNGDGFGDLVVGAGPGGGPRVVVLSGKTLINQGSVAATRAPLASFFSGDISTRNGVFVAARNLDNDGRSDVIVGGGSLAIAYRGRALAHGITERIFELGADTGATGGVFVG